MQWAAFVQDNASLNDMHIIFLTSLVLFLHGALAGQVLFQSKETGGRVRAFDVLHYALTLDFDESRKQVNGTTAITLTPTHQGIDSIVLDAVKMTIRSVTAAGSPVEYRADSGSIVLFLRPGLGERDTITLAISYS